LQKADRIEQVVWPREKTRQWVLTFPHQVRSWLLRSPELFNEVISVVVNRILFHSDPPPTGKPSAGRAPGEYWLPWAELLRKTVVVDPEVCTCRARMIVDDAITEGEKITETLARLGRRFASVHRPPNEAAIGG